MGGTCETFRGKSRAAYTVLGGIPEVKGPSVMHNLHVVTLKVTFSLIYYKNCNLKQCN